MLAFLLLAGCSGTIADREAQARTATTPVFQAEYCRVYAFEGQYGKLVYVAVITGRGSCTVAAQ